ncbi:MAG: glycosyltransferase [Verrucomicrobiae bacterium]|nr:glycosyltransferase [Verrucomicrobiae bacterium]
MRFSIITPSFRSGAWLKLCIASVADQTVPHEHLVQDAGSDDGTLDWLLQDSRVQAFVEKDQGMYDAINRGLRRARGEYLAYLNCDEQYLPGALAAVTDYFDRHPQTDVLLADAIIVNPQGEYLCHRQALTPRRAHTWVSGNLSLLTCATFFRRRLLERGLYFNPAYRDLGDAEWVLRLIDAGVRFDCLPLVTTAFTDTGENMNLKPNARRERALLQASAPAWARWLRPLIILHHRWRRLWAGHYFVPPCTYAIYTRQSPERRVTFHVARPTAVHRRHPGSGG